VFVLFKDRRPFFELDVDLSSEEIEDLRKTRIKKVFHHISEFRLAGD
jgi:hypothetical protein